MNLLPCPFCGSFPKVSEHGRVSCSACEAMGPYPGEAAQWNRRTYVGEMANGFPRFIDVSERHEICRFDDGEWSLRLKHGDDRAHTRYLTPDEKVLVEAAFRAGRKCENGDSNGR